MTWFLIYFIIGSILVLRRIEDVGNEMDLDSLSIGIFTAIKRIVTWPLWINK